MNKAIYGKRITIRGIVQGVGFRPFVYSLAQKYRLNGWVRNTSAGVEIEVAGDSQHLSNFVQEIRNNPPALSKIDQMNITDTNNIDYAQFAQKMVNLFQCHPMCPFVRIVCVNYSIPRTADSVIHSSIALIVGRVSPLFAASRMTGLIPQCPLS
jgi:acylphosphatase